ncbi:MAG: tRNA (guanosine(37)-N1)-methyltransferase TrmD, partial [Firmicutes bacterium]|nr:tRNA (guanosine(37)-N1)-methyltransferase TrmD [Bacillota bacterium]
MKIDVFTLFPELFGPVVTDSILGRANESGLVEVKVHNIRDYTTDKHNKTDDYPFGGGAGMVMYAEP